MATIEQDIALDFSFHSHAAKATKARDLNGAELEVRLEALRKEVGFLRRLTESCPPGWTPAQCVEAVIASIQVRMACGLVDPILEGQYDSLCDLAGDTDW